VTGRRLATSPLERGGADLAVAPLGVLGADLLRPLRAGPARSERAGWLVVVVGCMLLVPSMKRFSATSCPWD
jgi:membrane-associated PAP2 superfamily phosphatase